MVGGRLAKEKMMVKGEYFSFYKNMFREKGIDTKLVMYICSSLGIGTGYKQL